MTAGCHESPRTGGAALAGAPVVVLLGNPNAGKSTLFNSATGARQHVVNAPGTTVEVAEGTWRTPHGTVRLVDTPGTYSLVARSPDELVAARAATGADGGAPDVVVVVADATTLPRALVLLGQVLAPGALDGTTRVVVALTMLDAARAHGVTLDAATLSDTLGLPVVGVDPRSGAGLDTLADMLVADAPGTAGPRPASDDAADVFAWTAPVLDALGDATAPRVRTTLSDRVDAALLRPWVGLPVFGLVMWALLWLATTATAPVMDGVGRLVAWLGELVRPAVPGPAWVGGLLVDGVLQGVGTVLSFLPLLAIVFGAIAVLEDSGYLARVAVVTDRAVRRLGLDGRAVLPLVLGFGCNVPALTATRTLPDARARLLVGLVIPWTTCPARLTVYLLVATAVVPEHAATVVAAAYLASVVLVVGGAWVLRRTLVRDLVPEGLVLALPAYHRPGLRATARSVGARCASFVRRAGTVIVATLVVLWVLLAVPTTGSHAVGDVPVADSAYGAVAHGLAPALAPAGLDDWHVAGALVTGVVAKEVVVGALAQAYAVDEPAGAGPSTLTEHLRASLDVSSGGAATAAGLALVAFVLAYTPCIATIGEQRRLFGTRVAVLAALGQLTVAWTLAVLVFQVGRLL
ncbi:ferrous iron transporter B [Sanguibacter massiliensis]|uniref:ferrous iron transporter B n=1 Tax=Sanguibacter massiliensis TaxID=1973217 RepID=UPI000C827868|nr:ferrous iron transporter B [Sanguibacter massiliensis]